MRCFRHRLLTAFGILVLGTAAGLFAVRGYAKDRVAKQLEDATGRRATVGGLSLGWFSLVARDVRLMGAPPFDGEPLAVVDKLEARLGGHGRSMWQPSNVVATGVDLRYFRAASVDNLRGASRHLALENPARDALSAVAIQVRLGRLLGSVQPARGPRVSFRAREFSFDAAGGKRSLVVDGLAIETIGLCTLLLPRVEVETDRRPSTVSARGTGASLLLPGGGALVDGLSVTGTWSSAHGGKLRFGRVAAIREPAPAATFDLGLQADGQGIQLSADAGGIALAALRPLMGRTGIDPGRARASWHIYSSLDNGGAATPFEVDLRVQGVDVRHAAIDRRPWRDLSFEMHANGSFDLFGRRIYVDSGEVHALGARLEVVGWTELGALPRGSWTARTPRGAPLSCATLLEAQPGPVREVLAGLSLERSLGLSLSLAFDAAAWDALSLEIDVSPRCKAAAEPRVIDALRESLVSGLPPPAERVAGGPALGSYHPAFAALAEMPPHLVAAFLTSEDGHFFAHRGFDAEMIRRALAYDLERRALAKGGSTVTQQLAKNLFLSQDRTLARKLEETVLTWRLDQLLDKQRILELYLNVIELGPGIRGVREAARAYFGKELAQLRPLESAHLASLAPNPHGLYRRFREGRVDDGWLQRLYDLLAMMRRSGRLSSAELTAARSGKLSLRNRI